MSRTDKRGLQKKENWRKMSQSQYRVRRTESATRRKAKASPIFPEDEPLRKVKIRRTKWKWRAAELNRRHTVARRSANARREKSEGSSRRQVTKSEWRPKPDRRLEREKKQNGTLNENGELPITSATLTYFAEWGFVPKIWKSINRSKNQFLWTARKR